MDTVNTGGVCLQSRALIARRHAQTVSATPHTSRGKVSFFYLLSVSCKYWKPSAIFDFVPSFLNIIPLFVNIQYVHDNKSSLFFNRSLGRYQHRHASSESAGVGVGEAGMFWNRNCYVAGWNQMFNIYNAQKPKYGIWNFQEKHRGCRKMETPNDCESIFCFFKISCTKLTS